MRHLGSGSPVCLHPDIEVEPGAGFGIGVASSDPAVAQNADLQNHHQRGAKGDREPLRSLQNKAAGSGFELARTR